MSAPQVLRRQRLSASDFVHSGPDSPAGRYLRTFWQPIFHSVDLAPERPLPLRIMSESFTLYRGAGGQAFLVDFRCPHRGAQLSAGWVEGDELRCFYHGWKFAGDGRCTEQPAEENAFCNEVSVRSFPTREYLGLIFAFLGEGEPPPFPRYPQFERFDGFVEINAYSRECNYFQNLENSLDMSHVGFVHGDNSAAFTGIGQGKRLTAKESDWGVSYTFTRPDGQSRTQQFGMPNLFYMTALPTDPDIGWQESLFWFVPIDDERHIQFWLTRVRAAGEVARRIRERRQRRRQEIDLAHQEVCEDILAGRLALRDVDPTRVDLVQLQDDVAQVGQGRIADRDAERLVRGDVGVVAIRRLWSREITALLEGRPLKSWQLTDGTAPRAWGLDDGRPGLVGGSGTMSSGDVAAEIVDVRPHVEVELQLRALRGEPRR
ncbi:MAG TPA: Rieske 2Fe-2S domain-containing protein [Xanthobacteraceae bacterium]|jgi:5,5'-dehydrodivanillate O-demethylase